MRDQNAQQLLARVMAWQEEETVTPYSYLRIISTINISALALVSGS